MSIYLGENLVSGVATPIEGARNIGQVIQSTIPLSDAGLHLLDGGVIQRGSYTAFVDYISSLVSSYPDLFTTESNWQQSVNDYGVCGKFVYDSTNNTVRLPKITGFTEGAIDPTVLGNLTEAGLPNITGDIIPTSHYSGVVATNAFYATTRTGSTVTRASAAGDTSIIGLDASRSSSIYGNSNTVQPQSIKVLYYIVIATSTKTDIEVDIDEIATDLNGKVSIQDLSTIHCVVETYQNGTDWYRIYDDGWCEQGGRVSSTPQTVNFLKAFIDMNYTVTGGLIPGNTSTSYEHLNIGSLTTTSFYYTAYDGYQLMWAAYGYGA